MAVRGASPVKTVCKAKKDKHGAGGRLGLGLIPCGLTTDGWWRVHCDRAYAPCMNAKTAGTAAYANSRAPAGRPEMTGGKRGQGWSRYVQDAPEARMYCSSRGQQGAHVAREAGVQLRAPHMMRDNHYGWFEDETGVTA